MKRETVVIMKDAHVEWSAKGQGRQGDPVLYVRGYATITDRHFDGQGLADEIWQRCFRDDPSPRDALKRLIPSLDGHWTLVARWPDGKALAATDHVCGVPLFYAVTAAKIVIAASHEDVREECSLHEIDLNAACEFLLWGYVTGNETLYKQVHQMQPGEIVEFDPQADEAPLKATRYYRYFPKAYATEPADQLEEELAGIMESLMRNFLNGFDGGKILVPLSGGLDSRLIVALLKKNGFENVLCYTYGRAGNKEAQCSQQVAKALGYEWRFYEYDDGHWARWMPSAQMQEFWRYCSKGTCMPSFLSFPAVLMLMDELGGSGNPMFFLGHSVDLPAGGRMPPYRDELAAGKVTRPFQLLQTHCVWESFRPSRLPKAIASHILGKLDRLSAAPFGGADCDPVASCEMWDGENRQPHLIVNTVRAQEFASARWRTLWDYPLTDFLIRLPFEHRYRRRMYATVLQERIFTGRAAELAEIPVADAGVWRGRDGLPMQLVKDSAPKAAIRGLLHDLGLMRFLRRRQHPTMRETYLHHERWFSGAQLPGDLTVQQAMARYWTLEKLPKELKGIVKPFLRYRLDLMHWLALLAAISLGEFCAEAGQASR